jgi:hypothetical protein
MRICTRPESHDKPHKCRQTKAKKPLIQKKNQIKIRLSNHGLHVENEIPTVLENVSKDLDTSLHSTLENIKTFKQSRVDVIRLGDLIVEFDQRESQQLAVYVITKVLLLDFMITLEGPAAANQLLENVQFLDSSKLISNDISEKKASLRRLRSSLTRQQESSWDLEYGPIANHTSFLISIPCNSQQYKSQFLVLLYFIDHKYEMNPTEQSYYVLFSLPFRCCRDFYVYNECVLLCSFLLLT